MKIRAGTFVQDVKSGLRGPDLVAKYHISPDNFTGILRQCLQRRLLSVNEVELLEAQSFSLPQARPRGGHDLQSGSPPEVEALAIERVSGNGETSIPEGRSRGGSNGGAMRPEAYATDGSAGQGDGASQLWALKLYSKTVGNRDKFVRDLAAVLAVDVREAERTLDRAPAVVKSGLTKEKAERLSSVLASIGALCLIEEQGISAETSGSEAANPALALFPPRAMAAADKGLLQDKLRASAVVMTAAVIALCITAVYLINKTAPLREERMSVGQSAVGGRGALREADVETRTPEEARSFLLGEIARLEGEINQLQSRIYEQRFILDGLAKAYGSAEELKDKDAELRGMIQELGAKHKELSGYQKGIDSIRNQLAERSVGES